MSSKKVEREDIRLITHDGHPAIEIGDAMVLLRTEFEGAPAREAEVSQYEGHPFAALDFDEEYFGGLLEITPEFKGADDVE